MAKSHGSVQIAITTDAVSDSILYLPPSFATSDNGMADARLLVWRSNALKRRLVLHTALRSGPADVASATPRVFQALGGVGQGRLNCEYRKANWLDVVRYVRGAPLAVGVAVLSALSAVFAAWFAFRDDVGSGDDTAFAVIAVVFAVNVLLGSLQFWKSLKEV